MKSDAVLLDLSAIVAQPGARGSFDYSLDLVSDEELVLEGPVSVSLEALNSGKALLIMGSFTAKVHLACARCLEDVLVEMRGKIDEQFSLPGISEPELELIDQVEPKESAFSDQVLNVSELIRQEVLISLPLKVLCRPDCTGLCPTCGENLKAQTCQCEPLAGHAAWEALRTLAKKRKE